MIHIIDLSWRHPSNYHFALSCEDVSLQECFLSYRQMNEATFVAVKLPRGLYRILKAPVIDDQRKLRRCVRESTMRKMLKIVLDDCAKTR